MKMYQLSHGNNGGGCGFIIPSTFPMDKYHQKEANRKILPRDFRIDDPLDKWNFAPSADTIDLTRNGFISPSPNLKNPSHIFDAVENILLKDSLARGTALYKDEVKEDTSIVGNKFKHPFTPNYDISFVKIDWLKEHEQIVSKERVQNLHDAIVEWDEYRLPLLVDSRSGAILDGHHRYAAGRIMGLSRLPALLVDYLNDDSVSVDVWPDCGLDSLTKEDVIKMSLSDAVYPPKTSKHKILASKNPPPIHVPLSKLR